MLKINNTKNNIDYVVVFVLIFISGSPLMKNHVETVAISRIMFFLLTFIYWLRYSHRVFSKSFFLYSFLFLVIFISHSLLFGVIPIIDIFNYYVVLFCAYFVINTLKLRFIKVYSDLMLYITIISIVFFFSIVLIPSLRFYLLGFALKHPNPEVNMAPNLIIYHMRGVMNFEIFRNSGLFWEPGAFSGFIIVGLLFNIYNREHLFSKQNIILLIGLFSTLSTTGYLALMLVFLFNYLIRTDGQNKYVIVPVVIITSIIAFNTLPFLGNKFNERLEQTQERHLRYDTRTRFSSFIVDLQDLSTSPFIGKGTSDLTRYSQQELVYGTNRNNGVTDFAVRFGLFGFIFYFYSMYLGFRKLSFFYKINKNSAYWSLLIIFVIGFSELYFRQPMFVLLSILPYSFD